jgi:hypothetical protein
MMRTLVDTGAELMMVMSIVLLDWLAYVDSLSPAAPPLISSDGCLGSGKCHNIRHGGAICWVFLSTEQCHPSMLHYLRPPRAQIHHLVLDLHSTVAMPEIFSPICLA